MISLTDIVIVSAKRTPIGKFGGALAPFSAVDLGSQISQYTLEQASLDAQAIDYVIFGNVLQAGNGQNPARQIACNSHVPYTVPAVTVNQVCGSGLKAILMAIQAIALEDAKIVLAGGSESMSNAPYYAKAERWGARLGNQTLIDSIIHDGLTDAFSHEHMGITAENVAQAYNISRQAQDQFALASHQKASRANMTQEIMPVHIQTKKEDYLLTRDESIRDNLTLAALEKLKAAFKPDGSVTAGNASSLNDGAAALILMSRQEAMARGLTPLASIVGYAEIGNDPNYMGFAPYHAVTKLCDKLAMSPQDFDCIESNEAFAAQSLAVLQELKVDSHKVNINGGAIALGHPIGASGARIVVSLIHALQQTNGTYGLATLCVGGGIGLALAIKNEQASA